MSSESTLNLNYSIIEKNHLKFDLSIIHSRAILTKMMTLLFAFKLLLLI